MVSEGTFRLDLYYRINVMTIKAPALADHPGDILLLADFFVKLYSDQYNKTVEGIAPEAMTLLQRYAWPGNVRELENVIQSAIIRSDTEIIQPTDLGDRFQDMAVPVESDGLQIGTFERLLSDFKVKLAMKAIEDCRGNKTMAAKSLDISRAYLHRLIRVDDEEQAINAA